MIPTSRAATAAESVIFGSTPETADLARIAEHSGTPVHVLFEQLLRDRYLALRRVLAAAESVRLYHSVKANFETRVLATLRRRTTSDRGAHGGVATALGAASRAGARSAPNTRRRRRGDVWPGSRGEAAVGAGGRERSPACPGLRPSCPRRCAHGGDLCARRSSLADGPPSAPLGRRAARGIPPASRDVTVAVAVPPRLSCASGANAVCGQRMRIGVVGGGSWGTALAKLLAELEHQVTLWFHNPEVERVTAEHRENRVYLPGFRLPDSLRTTTSIGEAVAGAAVVVAVCPSHATRAVMQEAASMLAPDALLVSASKGIEEGSLKRMSEVLVDVAGWQRAGHVAALSGPSFAREVAAGMPTAVTLAAADAGVAGRLQQTFLGPTFRVYASTDLVGVEVGGAVKNVIAIAAGVSDGLGFGSSTRAALITRGVAEIARLVQRLGGDPRTVSGLSGVGDLVLTSTGDLSRNRTVGLRLGRGESLSEILADMQMVAEGVKNSITVCELARRAGVEMPIAEQIRQLLHEDKPARQVVGDLLSRQARPEFWS